MTLVCTVQGRAACRRRKGRGRGKKRKGKKEARFISRLRIGPQRGQEERRPTDLKKEGKRKMDREDTQTADCVP